MVRRPVESGFDSMPKVESHFHSPVSACRGERPSCVGTSTGQSILLRAVLHCARLSAAVQICDLESTAYSAFSSAGGHRRFWESGCFVAMALRRTKIPPDNKRAPAELDSHVRLKEVDIRERQYKNHDLNLDFEFNEVAQDVCQTQLSETMRRTLRSRVLLPSAGMAK